MGEEKKYTDNNIKCSNVSRGPSIGGIMPEGKKSETSLAIDGLRSSICRTEALIGQRFLPQVSA